MASVHDLFREYVYLDRKRKGDGVTPDEYERWKKLRSQLDQTFGNKAPAGKTRRDSVRFPTRIKLAFDCENGLRDALMTNLSRGGLFVNTAFPAPPRTQLLLRIRLESTGEMLEIPAEVVTNHVGPGCETGRLGMGVRFLSLDPDLEKKIDDLYAELGAQEADGVRE